MSSLEGRLLIASPDETDPDFVGTVILLVQHSEQQAVGLVLNRPTGKTIWGLFKRPFRDDLPVYAGGPVPGPLMAIHTCESLADLQILPGLYYAVKGKTLEKLVRQPDHPFRIFDGHAGWGPGQLEEQIETGGWRTAPATIEHVFHDEEDLWEKLNREGNS
jgi:putative transcriptional regulator